MICVQGSKWLFPGTGKNTWIKYTGTAGRAGSQFVLSLLVVPRGQSLLLGLKPEKKVPLLSIKIYLTVGGWRSEGVQAEKVSSFPIRALTDWGVNIIH